MIVPERNKRSVIMHIALINPIARNTHGYHTIGTKIPPLGLQVLSNLTPKEHTVEIIDEIFGTEETEKFITERGYDLVGLTAYTSSAPRAYELAKFCKSHGITVIMGGPHAWAVPDEAAEYFDSVVVGECDSFWKDILADVEKGQLKKRYEGRFCDMSQGFGRADQTKQAINGKYNVAAIQTSRGCPMGCDFCSVTEFNGRDIRRRPIDEIVEEWNTINKPFVFVVDDNFYGVSEKQADEAREILKAIIKNGKKHHWFSQTSLNMGGNVEDLKLAHKSGCVSMLVGIESFNEETLKAWGKGVNRKLLSEYKTYVDGFHKAGVSVIGCFVIGAEGDTPDTAADTLVKAVELGVDIIQITNLTPLPGTKMFDRMLENGEIFATNFPIDWERYTFIETVYNPKKMTPRELDECMYEIRRLATSRKWVWKRTWATFKRTKSIMTTLFVHGMNSAWRKLALCLHERDEHMFADVKTPKERMDILKKAY